MGFGGPFGRSVNFSRYPAEASRITEIEHTSEDLDCLPDQLTIHDISAMADGGTISLYSELSPTVEILISLPPKKAVLYPKRKPQIRVTVVDDNEKDSVIHLIAIRSNLESQVIQLLKTCRFENANTRQHKRIAAQNSGIGLPKILTDEERLERQKTVDEIVAFVESHEYVELNA